MKVFAIYGAEGHRQRMSFAKSTKYKTWGGKTQAMICSDITGTNDFVLMLCETEAEVDSQISDGFFEDARCGRVEEITKFGYINKNGTAFDSKHIFYEHVLMSALYEKEIHDVDVKVCAKIGDKFYVCDWREIPEVER